MYLCNKRHRLITTSLLYVVPEILEKTTVVYIYTFVQYLHH